MQTIARLNELFSQKVFQRNCYDDITDYLTRNNIPYLSGTKRIVINHPSNPNKVIKIAYKKAGVDDNVYDIIMSRYIGTYENIDPILRSNVALSTLVTVGSTFMISCDKIVVAKDFEPLKKFIRDNWNTGVTPNMRKAILRYVANDNDLMRQYNDLRVAMRKANIINSDIDIFSEPANYGFKLEGGSVKLVLCDIGSCIPMFENTHPKCPKCNSDLKPIIKKMDHSQETEDMINADDIFEKRGLYSCTNMSCVNNIDKISSPESIFSSVSADEALSMRINYDYTQLVDTEVFNRYVMEKFDAIRRNKVYMIGAYNPTEYVGDINAYAEALRNDFPDAYNRIANEYVAGNTPLMVVMFNNYVSQRDANRIAQNALDIQNFYENSRYLFQGGFLNAYAFINILVSNFQNTIGNSNDVWSFVQQFELDQAVADIYLMYIYDNAPDFRNINLGNPNVVYQQLGNRGLLNGLDNNTVNATINYIVKGYNNKL